MAEKKELSSLARQLLSGSKSVHLFTQQEFDDAITIAKAEIMTVAIETSKQAVMIEREACADIVEESYKTTNPSEPIPADWLLTLAEQIRNRLKKETA